MLYVACGATLLSAPAHAAETVGDARLEFEPRYGVDMPTAGVLHRGQYAFDAHMFRNGGLMLGVSVGIFDRMMIGLSYGGTNIIGIGSVQWQGAPGVTVKYRVIEESVLPAFTLGFESQGTEGYVNSANRFTIKSPGFYVAASKNYAWFGFFSVHGCLNYNLENHDGKVPNLSASAEKSLGENVSVSVEYDFGLNDHNATPQFGKDRGYLNLGVRWLVGGGLIVEADAKNLLGNEDGVPAGSRMVRIVYGSRF